MSKKLAFVATVIAAGVSFTAMAQQQPAAPQQRPATMIGSRPQELILSKIVVSDMVKSFEFYTKVIGLKPASAAPIPTAADNEKDFAEFPMNFTGTLADPFFVITKQKGVVPPRDFVKSLYIGFKVPSAKEAIARAEAAGYKSLRGVPADGPMTFAFISDPDGYSIEFVQAPTFPGK